jgi:S-adenosylmethionine/arginine decarboxylase-like enzyme
MSYWGYHAIMNLSRCSALSIRCPRIIKGFSDSLVKRIDMVPYGPPQIVMFGTGNKKGYTLVQLIETSNIMAHFVEENNSAYLDVFSCKPFNPKHVEEHVMDWFNPVHVETYFLKRNAHNFRLPTNEQLK